MNGESVRLSQAVLPASLPIVPVFELGFVHAFGAFVEPAAAPGSQLGLYVGDGFAAAEMHVSGFPAHIVEQSRFVPFFGQGREFDAGTVGRQTANEPMSMKTDTRIFDADG